MNQADILKTDNLFISRKEFNETMNVNAHKFNSLLLRVADLEESVMPGNLTEKDMIAPIQANRLQFVAAIQSCVADLAQQYDLIFMYDEATGADTVRKLQLEAIRKTLEVASYTASKSLAQYDCVKKLQLIDPEEILKGLAP